MVSLHLIWIGALFLNSAVPHPDRIDAPEPAGERILLASGICPQNRKTPSAPSRISRKENPLKSNPQNMSKGRELYHKKSKPNACKLCHGIRGNGNGRLAENLNPPPRNFTCTDTMKTISDGQMFWIIKNGSRGTAMPAHKSTLSDQEIWKLILYLRKFSK